MEMSQQEQNDLFAIVASVLHMGNVGFSEEDGVATILKPASVDAVATVINSEIIFVKIVNIFAKSNYQKQITIKIISLPYFIKIIIFFLIIIITYFHFELFHYICINIYVNTLFANC